MENILFGGGIRRVSSWRGRDRQLTPPEPDINRLFRTMFSVRDASEFMTLLSELQEGLDSIIYGADELERPEDPGFAYEIARIAYAVQLLQDSLQNVFIIRSHRSALEKLLA